MTARWLLLRDRFTPRQREQWGRVLAAYSRDGALNRAQLDYLAQQVADDAVIDPGKVAALGAPVSAP